MRGADELLDDTPLVVIPGGVDHDCVGWDEPHPRDRVLLRPSRLDRLLRPSSSPPSLASESVVASWYPVRVAAVQPAKVPWSGVRQRLGASRCGPCCSRSCAPFVGLRAELAIGAALFLVPQVLGVFERKLPNAPAIHRLLPKRFLKLTLMLLIGRQVGEWLGATVDDPAKLIRLG